MNRILVVLLLVASLGACKKSAEPAKETALHPFRDKVLVAPNVYAENASQFVKWEGKAVPLGDYMPEAFERTRLGTAVFSPDQRIHLDFIQNTVHFPSFFELIDARTSALLGKYAVMSSTDARWYFAGNGAAYLYQNHLQLCGPSYTRKFVKTGKSLSEVKQPLLYLGAETRVEETTSLFDSPTSQKIVASVVKDSTVTVVGMAAGTEERDDMALLVKTGFGLTGWHRPGVEGSGVLSIYQCN